MHYLVLQLCGANLWLVYDWLVVSFSSSNGFFDGLCLCSSLAFFIALLSGWSFRVWCSLDGICSFSSSCYVSFWFWYVLASCWWFLLLLWVVTGTFNDLFLIGWLLFCIYGGWIPFVGFYWLMVFDYVFPARFSMVVGLPLIALGLWDSDGFWKLVMMLLLDWLALGLDVFGSCCSSGILSLVWMILFPPIVLIIVSRGSPFVREVCLLYYAFLFPSLLGRLTPMLSSFSQVFSGLVRFVVRGSWCLPLEIVCVAGRRFREAGLLLLVHYFYVASRFWRYLVAVRFCRFESSCC